MAVRWLYDGGIAEYKFSSNQAQVTTQEIINGATDINIVTNLEKLDQEINFWSLQFDFGEKSYKGMYYIVCAIRAMSQRKPVSSR